jgi:hypothetical protein
VKIEKTVSDDDIEFLFYLPCGTKLQAWRALNDYGWRVRIGNIGQTIYVDLSDQNAEAIIEMVATLARNTPGSQIGPVEVSGVTVGR